MCSHYQMIIKPSNSKLLFNFYSQAIRHSTHSHDNDNLLHFINSRMQPSITAFFKTKAPAPKKETNNDSNNENESNESTNDDEPQVVDDKDDSSRSKSRSPSKSPGPAVEAKKRPLVSDDNDSDDDEVIIAPRNNKRQALSSAESTPVKNKEGGADDKKGEEKISVVAVNPKSAGDTETKTPTKAQQQLFPQKPVAQSPLFNTELLVKKKISSGAFALHENIGASWFKALQNEFEKPYFKKLSTFVQDQRKAKTVYPPPEQVYTWTHHHTIRETRVVIIGQDPYHGPNQAHGLSFSVQKGVAIPKSLQNIYKELQSDIADYKHPGHGNLTGWSKQGVLMLNACLTVNKGEANSHQGKGWETFTDAVISWISKNVSHSVVFLLWGKFAQKKSTIIDKRHKILTAAHPSPLSADNGFFGCKHFSKTNAYLRSQKLTEIDWAAL
uniref:Uracil-DNA glycosylase n=1 Tax=Aceria tosichella TaxID=561515 RepID=A0A6G1SEJ9_9ACAR